jgi:hypothetical protein
MIWNMADGDEQHDIGESGLNVDHTPDASLRTRSQSRSRQSSLRKSGKFRKLYTPKESPDVDENTEKSHESCPKRMRLSTVSHNATCGNGSHVDSSFDVVDATPCTNKTKSSAFQSYFNNHISVTGRDHKVMPTSVQQCKSLHDLFNKNDLGRVSPLSFRSGIHTDALNTTKTTEKDELFGRKERKSPLVSGITSLWATKTPPASGSESRIPVRSLDGSPSFMTDGMCIRQAEITNHTKLCAQAQNTMKTTEKDELFGRKERKSPLVSGITSLWATKTPPASSSESRIPVRSVGGSPSFMTDGMRIRQAEITNHTKLCGPGHISELTQKTPCRTEQVGSLQKSLQCSESEENELPATQPVSSLLLKGQSHQLLCIFLIMNIVSCT